MFFCFKKSTDNRQRSTVFVQILVQKTWFILKNFSLLKLDFSLSTPTPQTPFFHPKEDSSFLSSKWRL